MHNNRVVSVHLTSFRRTCFYFQEGTNCAQADHSTNDIITPGTGKVNLFQQFPHIPHIPFAYSSTALSAAKRPAPLMFIRLILFHCRASA